MSAILLNPTPECSELEVMGGCNTGERHTVFEKGWDDLKAREHFRPLSLGELAECSVLQHALASSCRGYRLLALTSIGIDLELLHTRRELLDGGLAIEPGGI